MTVGIDVDGAFGRLGYDDDSVLGLTILSTACLSRRTEIDQRTPFRLWIESDGSRRNRPFASSTAAGPIGNYALLISKR